MTFAELFAEVGRVLPKGSYSVEVEAWCHRHAAGNSEQTLEWSIWDADRGVHYKGKSPEHLLAGLKQERLPAPSAPLDTVVIA